jgi:hypothetical protein
MSWSEKYKRSIDCDNPKGFSQRAHCQGKRKKLKEQLKPFRTVEQIAKKHRLKVSFIQKQLDMGQPIEHEHTKNHEIAREIALQHIDEIPDYYTRLKKMEASAKKNHKKFKDVKENITIENSDGNTFAEVIDLIKPDPIKSNVKEDLRNWFDPTHPEGGWKRYNTKGEAIGPCAREPGEPKPKCLSNAKAAKLRSQGGAKKIASAVRRKRRVDPVANRKGKGGKPKMVSNKITENALNYDWDTPIRERADRYCPKCAKLELRNECKYGPKYWDMFSLPAEIITNKKDYAITMPHSGPDSISSSQPLSSNQIKYNIAQVHPANESKEMDHEYSMARSELSKILDAAKRLKKKMKGEGNIEAWVQSKITKAADYIDTAADYVDSGEMQKEACWDGYKRKKGTKKFDPGSCVKEENKPTNPALWSRAKSLAKQKFDVYPSAYANGWAAKWYKSKGGGWKSVSETFTYSNWRDELIIEGWEDKINKMTPQQIADLKKSNPGAAEKIDKMVYQAKSATPKPVGSGSQLPNVPRRPQTTGSEVTRADVRGGTPAAQRAASGAGGYKPGVGVTKDFKLDPNFKPRGAAPSVPGKPAGLVSKVFKMIKNPKVAIPAAIAGGLYGLATAPKKQQKEEYSNWREELGLTEDWQKVNRQDKTDGLSQKAVDAYRRENPGSKLQTAVTEKKPKGKRAKRRANFCRRMKGMKNKLTSAETARDPDSRINKALRRWNCN